jgi:hypothetical protein
VKAFKTAIGVKKDLRIASLQYELLSDYIFFDMRYYLARDGEN